MKRIEDALKQTVTKLSNAPFQNKRCNLPCSNSRKKSLLAGKKKWTSGGKNFPPEFSPYFRTVAPEHSFHPPSLYVNSNPALFMRMSVAFRCSNEASSSSTSTTPLSHAIFYSPGAKFIIPNFSTTRNRNLHKFFFYLRFVHLPFRFYLFLLGLNFSGVFLSKRFFILGWVYYGSVALSSILWVLDS